MERLLIVYEWMLNYYNESFDEKFDVKDDIINIHNASIHKQDIIEKLKSQMWACRYCSPMKYEKCEQANKK